MRANLAMMFMLPFALIGGLLALVSAGLGVGFRATMRWVKATAESQVKRRRR